MENYLEEQAEKLASLSEDELKTLAGILLNKHGGVVGLTDASGDPVSPPTGPHP